MRGEGRRKGDWGVRGEKRGPPFVYQNVFFHRTQNNQKNELLLLDDGLSFFDFQPTDRPQNESHDRG
jgi:hypothetical protein